MDRQPFISRATHHVGSQFRDGYFIATHEVAGFVPTGDWQSAALEVALGLLTTKIEWSSIQLHGSAPHRADDIRRLTVQSGGFMLAADWTYSLSVMPGKRFVMLYHGADVVRINEPPEALLSRWRRVVPSKRAPFVAVAGMTGAALFCVVAGVVAWQLTGNDDYLVAGLSFAVLIGIALVGVIIGLRQMRA